MVEQPVLSGIVGNDFAVVSWSFPAVVSLQDGGVVVAHHAAALLVRIRSSNAGGSSHHGTVGTVDPFAARSHTGKQIIV